MTDTTARTAVADATTVRLPHTGLRVPDASVKLTRLRQMRTRNGVSFNANLRVNNRIVGTIDNEGNGGGTWFHPHDQRVYGQTHLAEYAAQCRSEEGQPVDVEALLDQLVDEYDWSRQVAAAGRQGRTVLRLIAFPTHDGTLTGDRIGLPPYPHDHADALIPRGDEQWARLVQEVRSGLADPGPHGWWQAYTAAGWRDITARPADVDAGLYR